MVAVEPPHISDNSFKFSCTFVYCSAEILPDAFYLLFHSIITLLGLRFFSIAWFVESFIFLLTYLLKRFCRFSENFRPKFVWEIDDHATTYFYIHRSYNRRQNCREIYALLSY